MSSCCVWKTVWGCFEVSNVSQAERSVKKYFADLNKKTGTLGLGWVRTFSQIFQSCLFRAHSKRPLFFDLLVNELGSRPCREYERPFFFTSIKMMLSIYFVWIFFFQFLNFQSWLGRINPLSRTAAREGKSCQLQGWHQCAHSQTKAFLEQHFAQECGWWVPHKKKKKCEIVDTVTFSARTHFWNIFVRSLQCQHVQSEVKL